MENWLSIVLISSIASGITHFITSYSQKKGENLATKEDIAEITRNVEDIKSEITNSNEIQRQKRELKYEAALGSLRIIDSFISKSTIYAADGVTPVPTMKQHIKVEEARACYNQLVLAYDNINVVDLYMQLINPPYPNFPAFKVLDEYRNLLRGELGFGDKMEFNPDRTWIGAIVE